MKVTVITFILLTFLIGINNISDRTYYPQKLRVPASMDSRDCALLLKNIFNVAGKSDVRTKLWGKFQGSNQFDYKEFEEAKLLSLENDIQDTYLIGENISSERLLGQIEAFTIKNNLVGGGDFQKLGYWPRKRLTSLVNKFNKKQKFSEQDLKDFVTDLYLNVYGPNKGISFWSKPKQERVKDVIFQRVWEELATKNIEETFKTLKVFDYQTTSVIGKTKNLLKRLHPIILNLPMVFTGVYIPNFLPKAGRLKIDDEILDLISEHGFDSDIVIDKIRSKHKLPLLSGHRYQQFRKWYSMGMTVFLIWAGIELYGEDIDEVTSQAIEKLGEGVDILFKVNFLERNDVTTGVGEEDRPSGKTFCRAIKSCQDNGNDLLRCRGLMDPQGLCKDL